MHSEVTLPKKAIIELALAEESANQANQEIINEIFTDLSEGEIIIPWCKQVIKVVVLDA